MVFSCSPDKKTVNYVLGVTFYMHNMPLYFQEEIVITNTFFSILEM